MVLLANEDNLWDEESLKEKEKVVGRTLTVVADIDSALSAILSAFSEQARAFLRKKQKRFLRFFARLDTTT